MSTTRNWPRWPPSPNCAPRSNSNPAPTPTPSPNRSARSPRPRATSTRPGGSGCRAWRRRSSTPPWQSHRDGLIADWKRDHDADGDGDGAEQAPPFPDTVDAFMGLIEAGWDTEAARRPHGQHTTVVVHVDVEKRVAALHLGPLLTDDERAVSDLRCHLRGLVRTPRPGHRVGRATRTVNRRLRRALEHRDRCCVVPGCGATRGLHAHHIVHWEDGGPTELFNLVLVCPYHHRLHHRGGITITGPAHRLVVTDSEGEPLHARIAGPPTHHTPTRRAAVPRPDRRTRRLVVVPTLRTTTTELVTREVAGMDPAALQRRRQRAPRGLVRRTHPVQPVIGQRGSHDLQAHRQSVIRRETRGHRHPAVPGEVDGSVQRSNRYIASGSSTFSPSANAVVGVAGETRTSTRS